MSKPRILLINPDWTGIRNQKQRQFKRLWPPLSLCLAAAMAEREGLEAHVLDNQVLGLSPRDIGEEARAFDRVFVTSTPYDRWQCPSLDISFFFDAIAHIDKDKLFLCGSHVTERPQAILKHSGARAAILSEPEAAILDLSMGSSPENTPGTAWIRDGDLVRNPAREYIADMDSLPYPAFHLLDMCAYHYFPVMGRGFGILEASRGCPGKCNFCYMGMYGRKVRRKSPDRFLDEVQYVTRRFGLKNLYFMDLEFALSRKFVMAFCQGLLDRGLHVNWCCQTRATDMDPDVAAIMAKSGCSLVHFGVEAGSPRILEQTGKGITVEDCIRAVELCKRHGMRTALFMNFGFPGETREDMKQTIKLALRLDPTYAAFHLIVPFPGTRLAADMGLDPEDFPPHQYPHYNFFSHDLKALQKTMHRAYARFYLRPGPVLAIAKDIFRMRRQRP